MPRGHEHDILAQYARFSGQFFSKVFLVKDCNGKKNDCCAVFGCNNDCLFPQKYTAKFSFSPEKRVLIRSEFPPGYPIILPKSN